MATLLAVLSLALFASIYFGMVNSLLTFARAPARARLVSAQTAGLNRPVGHARR